MYIIISKGNQKEIKNNQLKGVKMKKVEYTTQTGRKVLIEIVEKEIIGHEEMSGQPITKDCWELNVELDGQYKIFSRLATAKYQGQDVNVLDCGSVKIMIPRDVYPAVKELVDIYHERL